MDNRGIKTQFNTSEAGDAINNAIDDMIVQITELKTLIYNGGEELYEEHILFDLCDFLEKPNRDIEDVLSLIQRFLTSFKEFSKQPHIGE